MSTVSVLTAAVLAAEPSGRESVLTVDTTCGQVPKQLELEKKFKNFLFFSTCATTSLAPQLTGTETGRLKKSEKIDGTLEIVHTV